MTQPSSPSGASQSPSFEASIKRLAEIVEQLEKGDLPLEQALALFEDGVRLARSSQHELDRAEKRVEELLAVAEGGAAVTREIPQGGT